MSDSFPLPHGLPEIHCGDLPQRVHMGAGARGIFANVLDHVRNQSAWLSLTMLQTAKRILYGVPRVTLQQP